MGNPSAFFSVEDQKDQRQIKVFSFLLSTQTITLPFSHFLSLALSFSLPFSLSYLCLDDLSASFSTVLSQSMKCELGIAEKPFQKNWIPWPRASDGMPALLLLLP